MRSVLIKKNRNKTHELSKGYCEMDGVNKTLYIPLYGKAYVSRKKYNYQG